MGTTAKDGIECTAALIAPAFLLTAAHCVYAPNSGYLGNLRCERNIPRVIGYDFEAQGLARLCKARLVARLAVHGVSTVG